MLISISGSQSCGKTTILNELKKLNYNVIETKSARSVLERWNMPLSDIIKDPKLTAKFQVEIFNQKITDEIHFFDSPELWFTERTFMDLFAYATITLGKLNEYNDWLDNYYEKCKMHTKSYAHIFYIQAGLFPVEYDNVRSTNKHYSALIDLFMKKYIMEVNNQVDVIDFVELDRRIAFILNTVTNKV
jgi:predicted ATPase